MNEEKRFDEWNQRKKELHEKTREIYFRKGEIWWCALGVNIGYEQDGKNENFERPVLVLRKINRHLALIVPLSSKVKSHPYYHNYRYGDKTYSAIIFQVRVVSTKRFLRKLGRLENADFYAVTAAETSFVHSEKNK